MLRLILPICIAVLANTATEQTPKGDPDRGSEIYERCLACHNLTHNRTGPRHCGLVGRRAGSLPGFDYSPALRNAGFVWDRARLDRFLADPLAMLPETSMGYDGVKDAGERADLIAYLEQAKIGSELCD